MDPAIAVPNPARLRPAAASHADRRAVVAGTAIITGATVVGTAIFMADHDGAGAVFNGWSPVAIAIIGLSLSILGGEGPETEGDDSKKAENQLTHFNISSTPLKGGLQRCSDRVLIPRRYLKGFN
jgi:hypothetical protein